jgi:CRP/FNR family transcriptional regulator
MKPAAPVATAATSALTCANCKLRAICMPMDLSAAELDRIDQVVTKHVRVKRGEALYRHGDAFQAIYTVRSGFIKTSVANASGREQVTGFQMAGETLGLDGIVTERHHGDAVALEDTEVCAIHFAKLEALTREIPAVQHHMHKAMSREIVREHGMMLLLGSMKAEERLAAFLLNLVKRLRARGFSGTELMLRMTREEIGSYLGLKLETVSRLFSKLAVDGIIEVRHKHVRIADIARLQAIECEAAAL